ncbi:MAG: response regulator [Kofleriaceae bacterium]
MTAPALDSQGVLAPVAYERARMLAPIMFVAMVAWLGFLAITGELTPITTVVDAFCCSLAGVIALLARRSRFARHGDVLLAVLWCAPVISTLVAANHAPGPLYAMLLPLEIVGTVVLLDTRWVVGLLGALLGIWIAMNLGGRDAAVYILVVVTATTFAIAMQIMLRRAILEHATTASELTFQLAERNRLEQQLLHAQRMEAVGTLAAGLAHDMNNVLASITSFAGLLDDEVQSTRGRSDLEQIVQQSMRGAELTRGLLAFSRRGQYRKDTIRVDDIVLEVLPMLERTLPRSIEVSHNLAGGQHCIEGDPVQLGQALINLCLNAAEAMTGRGTLSISTAITELSGEAATTLALTPATYARLQVTDTGVGMDAATRLRVFEPFFTTTPAGDGTGLGLGGVWGIIPAQGGVVAVDSTKGSGATFSVYLPVSLARGPSRLLPVMMRTSQLDRIGTVLVADDEPAVRAGTVRILQRMGLSALEAANGEEALAQFTDHAAVIDLVILDMGMPVMGGAECFRKLREHSQVPVLIATGYAVDEHVQEMVASGASLIEKPFPANDLIRAVGDLLERSRA